MKNEEIEAARTASIRAAFPGKSDEWLTDPETPASGFWEGLYLGLECSFTGQEPPNEERLQDGILASRKALESGFLSEYEWGIIYDALMNKIRDKIRESGKTIDYYSRKWGSCQKGFARNRAGKSVMSTVRLFKAMHVMGIYIRMGHWGHVKSYYHSEYVDVLRMIREKAYEMGHKALADKAGVQVTHLRRIVSGETDPACTTFLKVLLCAGIRIYFK